MRCLSEIVKKPFTEKQLLEWEEIRKKGKFSYALEKAIIFSPLMFIAYLIIYYFLGQEEFGIGVIFKCLLKGFSLCLSLFFFDMLYIEYHLKKSKLNSK